MMESVVNRVYALQYRLQRYWWIKRSKRSRIQGMCLVFHHITDFRADISDSCQCKTCTFEQILVDFVAQGYRFVSVGEALSMMDARSGEKFAVVTFDDVPEDMFTNGYPILKKLNIPFTVFVTVDFVGNPGFLSHGQLDVLNAEPLCTIGAHTLTHPRLRDCRQADVEICGSKNRLEEMIGKPVEYFAYPYGRKSTVSRKNIRSAKAGGYKCAFSTIGADLSDYTSRKRWFLPRVVVNQIQRTDDR